MIKSDRLHEKHNHSEQQTALLTKRSKKKRRSYGENTEVMSNSNPHNIQLKVYYEEEFVTPVLVDEQEVNITSCTWKSEKCYTSNNDKVRVLVLVYNFENNPS